jgi:hypothetical protein
MYHQNFEQNIFLTNHIEVSHEGVHSVYMSISLRNLRASILLEKSSDWNKTKQDTLIFKYVKKIESTKILLGIQNQNTNYSLHKRTNYARLTIQSRIKRKKRFNLLHFEIFASRLIHWKKRCHSKPKKGFVHATKPKKGFEICNEFETIFKFRVILRNPQKFSWMLEKYL